MRVLIVTPAPKGSSKGNRITAQRWSRILRSLGAHVEIGEAFGDQNADLLLALHARKSAPAVARFHQSFPERPIVLALTGTDLYGDIHRSAAARKSLELAMRLVLLQPHGLNELPPRFRAKARVIYQSAAPPRNPPPPLKQVFEVCVIGHLRPVKDPFRTALAARRLPRESRIRVVHLGAALSREMEVRARAEMERNPRYLWLGELPRGRALRRLARSRLIALTSRMEGGANVISEAAAASTPVVASRISGSIGLLGEDYPGFFPVGDTLRLADLLRRCECDSEFYQDLAQRCARLIPLISPQRERESWQSLLQEVLP
ncbi:MAG: TIGR04348 family glycosyltransferase [Planctomycetes bacterium]|nr:TIGR04348 family glycosyltransferase [Planctomycetota bacterium]